MIKHGLGAGLFVVALLAANGCGQGSTADAAKAAAHRGRFLLADEPTDAVGVLDAREELELDGRPAMRALVLVGRIGGTAEPFTANQAVFVMTDASLFADEEEDSHHKCGPDCPYCSKGHDETMSLALVQFLDDDRQVLGIDARRLFSLCDGQTVVVRGRAHVDHAGYLIVSADGLYVRR